MAEYIHLLQYDYDGTTLVSDVNLTPSAITTYGFRTKKYVPDFAKWKRQTRNSSIVPGQALYDFVRDAQAAVIEVDIIATSINYLQTAKALLNSIMEQVHTGQRERNRARQYRAWKLADRPLNTATYTSKAEIVWMDVTAPETTIQDRNLYRCNGVVIVLTLDPFFTASFLNLASAQSINNGHLNRVKVTGDETVYTVTNAALTGNVVTLTVAETVALAAGATIVVSNVPLDAAFNGTFVVSSVGANTILYPKTNSNIGSAATTGSVVGQFVKGTGAAPTRIKVDGGSSATNKVAVAVRSRGAPANFSHWLWAKDATLTNNTVARNGDTTFSGNNTNNGTRTTAASTSELKTHRWLITSNVADMYGWLNGYLRCRSNTAGRYSVRGRMGLWDGTNPVFPQGGTGGYTLETAVAVGTDSGNALAWVELGMFLQPAIKAGLATVKGLIFELYTTCSSISGSPTFDVDGLALFPADDGAENTGFCSAKFDLGIAASGVGAGVFNALPDQSPAYLVDASDVVTFPTYDLRDGAPLWIKPHLAQDFYFALIDESTSAGNPRHDYTQTADITIDYELRQGAEGRIE